MVFNTLKEFYEYVALNTGESDDYTELQIEGKPVVQIDWQSGGTATHEKNGAFLEEVLAVVYTQLKNLNNEFPCRENSIALTKIEEAVLWLVARKAEREQRNVYGKNEK